VSLLVELLHFILTPLYSHGSGRGFEKKISQDMLLMKWLVIAPYLSVKMLV
jgi:hypothetical protein